MERLEFDNYIDFIEEVSYKFDVVKDLNIEDNEISIIAKYEEMIRVIELLIRSGFYIHSIEIDDVECNGYDDEYICSLTGFSNPDGEIWVEPMLRDNEKYLIDESNICYVFDNCSSKLLKSLEGRKIYEVSIDYETGSDCENCPDKYKCKDSVDIDKDKNKSDNIAVTTENENESSYKVNGKAVSKEEFDKVVKRIDDMYEDSVRDILLKYSAIQDELNEWRKVLYL
jgi:hypothetical protein